MIFTGTLIATTKQLLLRLVINTNNEVHMKKVTFLLFVALIVMVLGASSSSFAGKIYKWVDANGKVHYGERAPNGKGKRIEVKGTNRFGVAPAPAPKASDKGDAASKFLESVAAERKEKKEADDKSAKEKALADKNCSNARKRVASLKQGGRRYTVDEQGNRSYMDDADIQKRLNEAKKRVEKWCN
jgi:hypothetical protein